MTWVVYFVTGAVIGTLIGWLWERSRMQSRVLDERKDLSALEKELAALNATVDIRQETAGKELAARVREIEELREKGRNRSDELVSLQAQLSAVTANLQAARQMLAEKTQEGLAFKRERDDKAADLDKASRLLAVEQAECKSLREKLDTQMAAMEEMGRKFNTEFENIANRILDTKTQKFTELNKVNLTSILEPLGKNIAEFKSRVDEVYDRESKERFSLGEKVRELSELNQQISQEARNLTRALKGESKTQGRWGEVILESILEKSGLVKDREYFMEHELRDDAGNPLRSEDEGKKMRPDAVVSYPGNRRVIIDSKVSLNAYVRMVESDDPEVRKAEMLAHVASVKNHVVMLSGKGYDDYDKSLDFVMMFVPSEPAYNTALQGDPDLWHFAYERRILLLSPTNLITSLKLVADLWKREYQNRNALDIAERGAKLYDKFVGFVENLADVGTHLDRAQRKYGDAYKQLATGNDNLVLQATKLRELGLKAKKTLAADLVDSALAAELPPPGEEEAS